MKTKRAERELLGEAASLLDVLRDIRDELRYLRQDVRCELRGSTLRSASDVGELLSVEQMAAELQVIPPTVGRGSSRAPYLRAGLVTARSRAASIAFAGRTWKRSSQHHEQGPRPNRLHDRSMAWWVDFAAYRTRRFPTP